MLAPDAGRDERADRDASRRERSPESCSRRRSPSCSASQAVPDAIAIGIAAGFSFALLAIEYALFTTAITAYIVLVAHALGQSAFEAADERALATAAGLAIAGAALLAWRPAPAAAPLTRRQRARGRSAAASARAEIASSTSAKTSS